MTQRFPLVLALACALSGCFAPSTPNTRSDVSTPNDDNNLLTITSPTTMPVGEPYSKIKEGMTYPQVIRLLGPPAHEDGSGILNLMYAISPTESFVVRTSGNGDTSVVMKYFYTKYRMPAPDQPAR